MDALVTAPSVLILGAGFSLAATGGKLPLMRTFFDQLDADAFPLLDSYVRAVAGSPEEANVESVLLALDQMRTSPRSALFGWADGWKDQADAIRQDLANYTLNRLKTCQEIPDDMWAAELLYRCSPDTTVISMNYDNIAESILSQREGLRHLRAGTKAPTCAHCKMRLLLQKACSCMGRGKVEKDDWQGAILKPHGSVAWRRCLNAACCSYECLVADERCRPFEPCACPQCGEPCAPALVLPTMSKHLDDTPEIGVMWDAAFQALAAADSILLFGFSMPTSDELLIQMIRTAVCRGSRLRSVGSIDIDPEAVLGRFARCIPCGMAVERKPFPVAPGVQPGWFFSPLPAAVAPPA